MHYGGTLLRAPAQLREYNNSRYCYLGAFMESIFLQQVLNGLITGSVYSLIAIGLTMIFGVMKISNLAHGDFSMIGAYVTVFVMAWIPGWFGFVGSILAAIAVVGVIGLLLERLSLIHI